MDGYWNSDFNSGGPSIGLVGTADSEFEAAPKPLSSDFDATFLIDETNNCIIEDDFSLIRDIDNDSADESSNVSPDSNIETSSIFNESDDGKSDDDFFGEEEKEDLPTELTDEFLKNVELPFRNLSMQEFERSQFDVHGISTPLVETPELLKKSLEDLDSELSRLQACSSGKTQAYNIAVTQSKAYVSNGKFRLMFLRSNNFSIQGAASQILKFFELKRELWGENKLTKRITMEDFDETDLNTLENGHLQLLPTRDSAGRAIVFNNLNHLLYFDGENILRTIWYICMTALEDDETQRNGVVFVQFKFWQQMGMSPRRTMLWRGSKARDGIPMKLCIHCCFSKQSIPFVNLIQIAIDKFTSLRIRVLEGSFSELILALMSVGIPKGSIPVKDDGSTNKSVHLEWLKQRRLREKEGETLSTRGEMTTIPSLHDVLLGRGKHSQFHKGNLRLNQILEQSLSVYDKGDRKAKYKIVTGVLDKVKQNGGRFLKRGSTGDNWEVVDDLVARNKVSHDFRTVRKTKIKNSTNSKQRRIEDKETSEIQNDTSNQDLPTSKRRR